MKSPLTDWDDARAFLLSKKVWFFLNPDTHNYFTKKTIVDPLLAPRTLFQTPNVANCRLDIKSFTLIARHKLSNLGEDEREIERGRNIRLSYCIYKYAKETTLR